MFNALKYIKSLEAVGFRRDQAEAQVQLVVDAIEEDVATKSDLSEVRFDLKSEFADVKAEFADVKAEFTDVKAEFADVKTKFAELRSEIAEFKADVRAQFVTVNARLVHFEENLENRIVIRLGRTIVVCSTLMLAAIGLMLKFQ